jgi:hypothetical protein
MTSAYALPTVCALGAQPKNVLFLRHNGPSQKMRGRPLWVEAGSSSDAGHREDPIDEHASAVDPEQPSTWDVLNGG